MASPLARTGAVLLLLLALAALATPALAFSPRKQQQLLQPTSEATLSSEPTAPSPDQLPDCHKDHSSTVWMLISTVLVLGMTPALALFEAGMLRSKSTVSLITQIFCGLITLSVMWQVFGYSLTFGPSQGGVIGSLSHAFFIDVSYTECSRHAPKIPEALFAMFQMMFAVITPLLMTGAFAERLRFRSYFLFIIMWEILVYYPLAHWVWGGGFLGKWGTLDFAGGIVIHASAGTGSLVSALYLGRRKGFFDYMGEYPPSNLPLAATGGALLWIGWFGFNGGSALAADSVPVSALVSTQIGGSVSAFTWLMLSWWKHKPHSVALLNGALAGLAGITPASGYVNSEATFLLGFLFGVASFFSCHMMKGHFHIDDALDVSSVHGLTGIIGAIGLGFFAQKRLDPNGADGAFYGHPMQIVYQLVGVLVACAWAGWWTWALLKLLDQLPGGVRVSDDEEEVGLDWSEHHEIAYHKLHVLDDLSQAEEPLYPQHMDEHSANGVALDSSMMERRLLSHDGMVSLGRAASPAPTSTAVMRMSVPSTNNYKRASPLPPVVQAAGGVEPLAM